MSVEAWRIRAPFFLFAHASGFLVPRLCLGTRAKRPDLLGTERHGFFERALPLRERLRRDGEHQIEVHVFKTGLAQNLIRAFGLCGVVDAADYIIWRKKLGTTFQLPNEVSGVTPGSVTQEDYTAWRARFGNTSGAGSGATLSAVPEPSTFASVFMAAASICAAGFRRLWRYSRSAHR